MSAAAEAFGLHGQCALVTGAGSAQGIGFATARLLAGLGCRVALTATGARALERACELQALGHEASGHVVDLAERAETRRLVNELHGRWGRIDILVNNAGMSREGLPDPIGRFVELPDADWDEAIRRNLTTCYNVTRQVLPGMVARRHGRIVHVSSVTGPVVGNPGDSAYGAAKAALVGMSRSIALEVAASGVTINSVAPGWIATAAQTPVEARAGLHAPMGRSGTPEEVAAAIAFLAGPSARYITGQVLVIDGGNSLIENKSPSP